MAVAEGSVSCRGIGSEHADARGTCAVPVYLIEGIRGGGGIRLDPQQPEEEFSDGRTSPLRVFSLAVSYFFGPLR